MSILIPRRKLLGAASLLGMFGVGRATAGFMPAAEAITQNQMMIISAGCRQPAKLLSNYNGLSLSAWKSALANVVSQTGVARIACLGDSTTAGAQAVPTTNGFVPNSYPMFLAALFATPNGALFGGQSGDFFGDKYDGAVATVWDDRITQTGTWADDAQLGPGGNSWYCAAAASRTMQLSGTFNTVDAYYLGGAGSQTGVCAVSVNGGATLASLNMATGAVNGVQKQTIALGSLLINPYITVTYTSGACDLIGFDAYNSTAPQVKAWNWGWGGSTSTDWSVNTYWLSILNSCVNTGADLTIISLGINDWIAGTGTAAYSSALTTIASAMLGVGSVIMMTPFPTGTAQASIATQAQYVQAMKNVAVALGIPYIDMNAIFGSKAQMEADGYGSDPNHPNVAGYILVANTIYNALSMA